MKTGRHILFGILLGILLPAAPARAVDYTDPARWIALPTVPDKPVDVFYLYPTTWQATPADPLYCEIDNPGMLAGAKDVCARQASAFAPFANVFAPAYRQMNISKTLGAKTNDELMRSIAAVPAKDAAEALDYYFARHNGGRPFILAGHSQGTQVMMAVLMDYFKKHPALKERLVAAYLIGYSITEEFLAESGLSFATRDDDTGVVVSWNTEARGTPSPSGSPVILPGALGINPLNWRRDETYADAEKNLGALMPDAGGELVLIPGFSDAQLAPETGVLYSGVAPSSVPSLAPVFPEGSFHGYDYQFYYANIGRNALVRFCAHAEKTLQKQR